MKNKLYFMDELIFELKRMSHCTATVMNTIDFTIFFREAATMLLNAVNLFEDNLFDCAFYSVRQAFEIINSLIFLDQENNKLVEWFCKDRVYTNRQMLDKISKNYGIYSELLTKTPLNIFFEELILSNTKSNKIIHKQGLDTFYTFSIQHDYLNEFYSYLAQVFCYLNIVFIIYDPYGLIMSVEDLFVNLTIDIISTPINLQFIDKFCGIDILTSIKDTKFYQSVLNYCENNKNN